MRIVLKVFLDEKCSVRRGTNEYPYSLILLCIEFLIYSCLTHRPRLYSVLFVKSISEAISAFITASRSVIRQSFRIFTRFWPTNMAKTKSRWSEVIFFRFATKWHREFSKSRCDIIMPHKSVIQSPGRGYPTDGIYRQSNETSGKSEHWTHRKFEWLTMRPGYSRVVYLQDSRCVLIPRELLTYFYLDLSSWFSIDTRADCLDIHTGKPAI